MMMMLSALLPGLAAAGLALSTSLLLHIPVSMPAVLVAFSGTSLIYWLDHSLPFSPEDRINHPERAKWLQRHRLSTILCCILAGMTGMAGLIFLKHSGKLLCLVIALGSALYLFPILPGRKRLKSWPLTKPLFLATLWAGGCVLLPVLENGHAVNTALLVLLLYRLLYLLPNFMLNDRADHRGDQAYELRTLAVLVRDRTFQRLLRGVLASTFIMGFMLMQTSSPLLPALDLAGLLLYLPLSRRLEKMSRVYAGRALDVVACWPWITVMAGLASRAAL